MDRYVGDKQSQLGEAAELAASTVSQRGTNGDARDEFMTAASERFGHIAASELKQIWDAAIAAPGGGR